MLTLKNYSDRITLAFGVKEYFKTDMQRYRSGHNEAVLKTVCPQGRVGSNPTLCVRTRESSRTLKSKQQCNPERFQREDAVETEQRIALRKTSESSKNNLKQ